MSWKLKNLLITWDSKGIWKHIKDNLENKFNIIWVSRNFSDIKCDLSKIENIDKIVKYLEENTLLLDYIIINAWVGYFGEFNNWEISEYENIINLNLLSPIIMLRQIEKFLTKKAKVIFIWSIISKKFMKYWTVYQASKFGLRWFAWGLKSELRWKKVHIINPKIVDTWFHDNSEIIIKNWYKKTDINDITEVIENIIFWLENRFEIDL